MREVLGFLQNSRVFFLATTQGDQPKARPLGFVMAFEGKIYFGVGDEKDVYKQMQANPKVEIVSVNQEGNWLRLTGRASFDLRPEVFTAAVDILPVLGEMYGSDAPRFATFYLSEATATFLDLSGPIKTITL